jgi:mono/diheme cytochrome c family protein
MSFPRWSAVRFRRCLIAAVSVAGVALVMIGGSRFTGAQQAKKAKSAQPSSDATPVARGKYIVEDVAGCGNCHTPRKPDGELDRSRWLAGAPVPYLPAQPKSDWPIVAPRLAGLPPTSNAGMITLLTTGIWITGKPLREPMPRFHMTRSDAEAVLAYLKSLSPSQ